jgi:hypothetical protein
MYQVLLELQKQAFCNVFVLQLLVWSKPFNVLSQYKFTTLYRPSRKPCKVRYEVVQCLYMHQVAHSHATLLISYCSEYLIRSKRKKEPYLDDKFNASLCCTVLYPSNNKSFVAIRFWGVKE